MRPHGLFTGVLRMPARAMFASTSLVTLGDGEPVATIRWHTWSTRFEILDPAGVEEWVWGRKEGFLASRYVVYGQSNERVGDFRTGFWGVGGKCTASYPDGRTLTTKANWSNRKFSVVDVSGRLVGNIVNSRGLWRRDVLSFELTTPVLSMLEAIGLAECLRMALAAHRSAASTGAASGA